MTSRCWVTIRPRWRSAGREGADVIGVNCSGGPSQFLRILRAMREALSVQDGSETRPSNEGKCPVGEAECRLARTSQRTYYVSCRCGLLWRLRSLVRQAGANIMGGCCGTTPEHNCVPHGKYPEGCQPPEAEMQVSVSAEQVEVEAEAPSALAQRLASGQFSVCR